MCGLVELCGEMVILDFVELLYSCVQIAVVLYCRAWYCLDNVSL